jgi:hypothetical protein
VSCSPSNATHSPVPIVILPHTLNPRHITRAIMAVSSAPADQMSSITLTWNDDASAGAIPAHVYFSDDAHRSQAHPIGRHIRCPMYRVKH